MWSIGEYVDHVREVLFGMRFLLDIVLAQPGADLGEPPESEFQPDARIVDIDVALGGVEDEATDLRSRLLGLTAESWTLEVTLDGEAVNAHWCVRHAVHDATHHLLDIERLRSHL
jgi:hypothetical protein